MGVYIIRKVDYGRGKFQSILIQSSNLAVDGRSAVVIWAYMGVRGRVYKVARKEVFI